MPACYVISGCSGGGKSSLLSALAQRGYATIKEPGRRIVRQEIKEGGDALPWIDPVTFARRALAIARKDWEQVRSTHSPLTSVFFDRSAIDAVSFLKSLEPDTDMQAELGSICYEKMVFMAPPWSDIFRQDTERKHDFAKAREEFGRLMQHYPALGYQVMLLEKTTIEQRLEFVIQQIKLKG